MTITEISNLLTDTLRKLKKAKIDDESKLDLELLVIQLKRQLLIAGFDPLKNLEDVTIIDVSQLEQLTQQLDQVIQSEKKRVEIVRRITSIATSALRGAGIPIFS